MDKLPEATTVTPEHIESLIIGETYFTAADGTRAGYGTNIKPSDLVSESLGLLTFCVLVLHNGFTVVGKSGCSEPERFDAAFGCKYCREDAVNQVLAF